MRRCRNRRRGAGGTDNALERGQPSKFQAWGLVAMWRADLGVTLNAADVSAYADQWSSATHLAQVAAAKQPLYVLAALNGRPGIQFTAGNSDELTRAATNLFAAGPYTVVHMLRVDALGAGAFDAYFANTSAAGGFAIGNLVGGPNKKDVSHLGLEDHVDAVTGTGTFNCWTARRQAATAPELWIDAAQQALTAATSGLTNPGAAAVVALGDNHNGTGFASFTHLEACAFTSYVNDRVMQRLHHYIGARYARAI